MAVRPFDEIFRDFVINGLPASGPHHPHKGDIRDSLNALVAGPFPDNRVIKLNNANEGTENNIVVSASVAIPTAVYQVLYVLNVTQENTGPVTISGAINRNLVTNTNEPVPAGYLKPGMAVLCIDTGSELRMLSYGDVEKAVEDLVSQAEAAEAAAELAKEQAQNAASDAVSQGNVPIYSTRNAVETLEIPAGINAFRTNGFAGVGDGGAALYKRVASEPDHIGKVRSADGAWWEYIPEGPVNIRCLGAKGDGVSDDSAAVTSAFEMSGAVYAPVGIYAMNSAVTCLNKAVNFTGDGKGITVFKFMGGVHGFIFDNQLVFDPIDISSMSITTTDTTPSGRAVDLLWPKTFDGRMIHKGTIDKVQIEGFDNQNNGWRYGIRYLQAVDVTINDCNILGMYDNQSTQALNNRSQIGITFEGGVFPVQFRTVNSTVNCWYYGWYITGAPEGIMIHLCNSLHCRIGVHCVPTTFDPGIGGGSAKFRPQLDVSSSHFAVFENGVKIDGMIQSRVSGCLFYANEKATQDVTLIQVAEGGGIIIESNQFYKFTTGFNVNGIRFIGTKSGVARGNWFGAMATGIGFDASTGKMGGASDTGVEQYNNRFDGPYSVGSVVDQRP